jgi:hypothetical protein
MIKITKDSYEVFVELPITTIKFDRDKFDLITDNIYFLTRKSLTSDEIVREKGNIEDMNMGHWLCIKHKWQSTFNDHKLKSLDVEHLLNLRLI